MPSRWRPIDRRDPDLHGHEELVVDGQVVGSVHPRGPDEWRPVLEAQGPGPMCDSAERARRMVERAHRRLAVAGAS